jgi:hypothetical protein
MEDRYILLLWLLVIGCFSSCGTNQSLLHENFIIQTIVEDVNDESKGVAHPASDINWNAYWTRRLRNMRTTPDGERYARIAIEMRRSAGLPELR